MIELTGKEKVYLRGLAHKLKPIIQIGKDGVSGDFVSNLADCLEHHELIKIKLLDNAPEGKKETAAKIGKATSGEVVQIIGKTILLYRPFKEEPVIKLPKKS